MAFGWGMFRSPPRTSKYPRPEAGLRTMLSLGVRVVNRSLGKCFAPRAGSLKYGDSNVFGMLVLSP